MFSNSRMFRTIGASLAVALLLIGCAESQRPQPTGTAIFRGMNAISSTPSMTFKIEERGIGIVDYKQSSTAQQWDDFPYNFNFDYNVTGQIDAARLATTFVDTVTDQDYLIVLAGQFAAPQVFVWPSVLRTFDAGNTVFQLDFIHVATTIAEVDVYFDAPGTAPVLGNAIGSMQFGENLPPMDNESGDYEIILTVKDDPASVIYQSNTIAYAASTIRTISLLDADPSITAQAAVLLMDETGATIGLPDPGFAGTVRIQHAALQEVAVDVSINGDTANPFVTNVAFGETTGDIELPEGSQDFTYTETGNPGVIVLEQSIIVVNGRRNTHLLHGPATATSVAAQLDDRRPRATNALMRAANMSLNQTSVDIYLLEPGLTPVDAALGPVLFNLQYPLTSLYFDVAAGNYDMWVTVVADITMPLAGPIPINFANGDNVEISILDNVDPAIVDVDEYSR